MTHHATTTTPISALDLSIECYRRMWARRFRLKRAAADLDEELCHVDEDLSDAEADLAVQLKAEGPRVVDGREYRHATRDDCDVVEVRTVEG